MNLVVLSGNLTKDVESKTSGETKIAVISIAVNEGKDKVNFFDCVAFNKQAELISTYCNKGKKVLIRGKLDEDKWQAQDGTNRSKTKIIINEIEFLSKNESTEDNEDSEPVEDTSVSDGDLPF